MKLAVRYYSKTGNTQKLAHEIANAIDVKEETINTPINEETDILFLGSSVYAAGVSEEIKEFINNLDKTKVKKVVNFSTAAIISSTYKQIKKLVENKGIIMDDEEFHCKGSFKFLNKNRPNQKDLEDAKHFAENIIKRK